MKKISVEEAVGQELCHDITGIFPDGGKGVMFKRGHVIKDGDIPALLDIGKSHVFVWEADCGDVHEDDAALAAAEVVCGGGIDYDKTPSEGKILMYSAINGLFRVNRSVLKTINSVGDYTLACLPDNTDVRIGQKLGGIRIVPLVTKRGNVQAMTAAAKASDTPVFTVRPYAKLRCGVIITGSEIYYGRIQDKFEPIMRAKLSKFDAQFLGAVKCPDSMDAICGAIGGFMEQGAQLILLTGGMSVDPDDLTPAAIRSTGARLVTQGVPMQPGNMLTVAYLDGTVLIGVPGASMHSKVTSLDVFLPRIFAGFEVTKDDIPALGDGGFCAGCEVCVFPLCYFGRGNADS